MHSAGETGGQRVGMRQGEVGQGRDSVSWLHADHLGSLSEATTGSGGVSSRQRYCPYGRVRYRSGSPPTTYNFTGQRLDGTGLLFFQARYYDPDLRRFLQPDTIVPEPGNPQSLNRYAYGYNNPVKYIDRDGHFPVLPIVILAGIGLGVAIHEWISPPEQQLSPLSVEPVKEPRVAPPSSPDMTQWLVEQMRTTAQAPVTQAFHEHFSSPLPQDQLGALKAWVALVRSEGIWDFKGDIAGARLSTFPNVTLGDQQLNYQAVANIFFGFEGRATGQVGWWLEASAGAFQVVRWARENPSNIGPVTTFFDDPFDNWSIGFGIFLYDLYGQKLDALTPEAFNQALQEYIEQYGAPPPPLNP